MRSSEFAQLWEVLAGAAYAGVSPLDSDFRLTLLREPGIEIHQARMLLAQRGDVCRIACPIEKIKRASDLLILLLKGLNWNLDIGN